MKINIKLLLILIISIISLFGCLSLEINHKQYSDGSSDIRQTVDLSLLTNYLGSYGSYYASSTQDLNKEFCKNYENINCSFRDGKAILSKHYLSSEVFYKFEVNDGFFIKKYRLTIDEIPELGSKYSKKDMFNRSTYSYGTYGSYDSYFSSLRELKISDPKLKIVGTMFDSARIDYKYVVEMPGTITSAEGAVNINGSVATFDLVKQLKEGKSMIITSEEYNPLIVGFVGLIFCVFITIILISLKRKAGIEIKAKKEVK